MAAAGESESAPMAGKRRVPCVGAVVVNDAGQLLLIRRGHEPGKGLWSIPGGRVEPGETDEQAVVRELLEETGLVVACGQLLGRVERPGLADAVLDIRDYLASVTGGTLKAGDDAAAARWLSSPEVAALDAAGQLTGQLLVTLRGWSVLP
jgi:mutator protein MutT